LSDDAAEIHSNAKRPTGHDHELIEPGTRPWSPGVKIHRRRLPKLDDELPG